MFVKRVDFTVNILLLMVFLTEKYQSDFKSNRNETVSMKNISHVTYDFETR